MRREAKGGVGGRLRVGLEGEEWEGALIMLRMDRSHAQSKHQCLGICMCSLKRMY